MRTYPALPPAEAASQAVDFAHAWLAQAIRALRGEPVHQLTLTHLHVAQEALSAAETLLPRDRERASAVRLDGAVVDRGAGAAAPPEGPAPR